MTHKNLARNSKPRCEKPQWYICMQWEQWLGTNIFTIWPSVLFFFCMPVRLSVTIDRYTPQRLLWPYNMTIVLPNWFMAYKQSTLITEWKSNRRYHTILWNLLTFYQFYIWDLCQTMQIELQREREGRFTSISFGH